MGLLFRFIVVLRVGIKEKRANTQVKDYFKPVTQPATASPLVPVGPEVMHLHLDLSSAATLGVAGYC